MFFFKLCAHLPVFRDGPILTGRSYNVFFRYFLFFQCHSGAFLHVLVPRMNNLALHARVCRCLQKKMMFFSGSCNGSDGGWVGGG